MKTDLTANPTPNPDPNANPALTLIVPLKEMDFGEDGLVVLSLFDGCGAARVALARLDINVDQYHAVEIDENCKSILPDYYDQQALTELGWEKEGHLFQYSDITGPSLYCVIPSFSLP